jgi:hypothetical protein
MLYLPTQLPERVAIFLAIEVNLIVCYNKKHLCIVPVTDEEMEG